MNPLTHTAAAAPTVKLPTDRFPDASQRTCGDWLADTLPFAPHPYPPTPVGTYPAGSVKNRLFVAAVASITPWISTLFGGDATSRYRAAVFPAAFAHEFSSDMLCHTSTPVPAVLVLNNPAAATICASNWYPFADRNRINPMNDTPPDTPIVAVVAPALNARLLLHSCSPAGTTVRLTGSVTGPRPANEYAIPPCTALLLSKYWKNPGAAAAVDSSDSTAPNPVNVENPCLQESPCTGSVVVAPTFADRR